MRSFAILFSLCAVALANPAEEVIVEYLANGQMRCRSCRRDQWGRPSNDDCPPTNCPPPVRNPQCGEPDCSQPGNRNQIHHPTPDPNFFYQCEPTNIPGQFSPTLMPCACGTLFSSEYNRCVHPWEWRPDCPIQRDPPVLSEEFCREECPTCDDNGTTPRPTPPIPTIEPTPTPPNGCQCPCFPCIWWPCQPCQSNCPCNNQNNNQPQQPPQQIPQNPWPQPPQQIPQNPWPQPPQQIPQNPWQQPPQQIPQNPWPQPPQQIPQNPWPQPPHQIPQNPWQQPPHQLPQNRWPQELPQNPWDNQPIPW